jgi:putative transposase
MKRTCIEPENEQISQRRQCALLGLSWSTFRFSSQPSQVQEERKAFNQRVVRYMDELHIQYPWFGVNSYCTWLEKDWGIGVNPKRVRRLMREMGIRSLAPGPHTSKPCPGNKTYPYLLRDMAITRPNQVWCADITYIPMEKGHMYLVAVMDWYSRKILSWRISNTMDEGFCIEALKEAIEKFGQPLIFNTDQGSQFTGAAWINILENNRIQISMDGKGRAIDNVMIERAWRSYKYEYLYLQCPQNGTQLRSGTQNWIDFHNKRRYHESLGNRTPDEVYLEFDVKVAA